MTSGLVSSSVSSFFKMHKEGKNLHMAWFDRGFEEGRWGEVRYNQVEG